MKAKLKRITANLPADLLAEAIEVTHQGITDTLVLGLQMVKRISAYQKVQALKGKVNIELDIEVSRGRNSR
jgi:hypothetical protein